MYSSSVLCCATALRMILSSTSVMFITWLSGKPLARSHLRSRSTKREGAEIADVGEVVDGRSAGVHADGVVVGRGKLFDFLRQSIVEAHEFSLACRVLAALVI